MIKLLFTDWRKAKKDQIENGRHYNGRHGEYFRCVWCGKRLEEGQEYNIVMTNNIRSDYIEHISGNPLVCKYCHNLYGDDLIAELEDRVHELYHIHNNRYWWFLRKRK